MESRDEPLMARALLLAARARGNTSPNPMVGAVVATADGRVLGSGFHARAGAPHAEVHALGEAGAAARGATLYCTLEPCGHHGRTPPCAERIVGAGIARVVAATGDPNPLVSGKGFAFLRAHGVSVDVGVGHDEAERLNRPFFTTMRRGRPWVIAKIALSGDGFVAGAPGARTAMSSPQANRRSQLLRAEVDAIAVGSSTILVDDPVLTCRDVYRSRPLARVVFDRRLRVPLEARLFATLGKGPVIVVTDDAHLARRADHVRRLADAGVTVLTLPDAGPAASFAALVGYGIQSVLLEGGPTLHRSALAAGVVDRIRIIAGSRMSGPGGVPWIAPGELGVPVLSDRRIEPCGPDVMMEGDVYRTH